LQNASFDRAPYAPPSLAYNANGKLLCVVWEPEHGVGVWDVESGKSLRTLTCPEGDFLFHGVAFSPDRKRLAAAWHGVCLWDITTGKLIANYPLPKDIYALAFSPNGKMLAAGRKRPPQKPGPFEGVVSLLDPRTGKELAILGGHPNAVECLAFSPDGKTLAVGSAHQVLKIWDISGVKPPRK
jgi:WD40 repeat protein